MKLKLELEISKIGYVLYRNGMNPVLTATAEAEEDEKNITFTLRSDPPFIKEISFKADGIAAGTILDLREHFNVSLDPARLLEAAETMPCRVTLLAEGEDGSIKSESCDTEILPFEYWPGPDSPELIASFVTPNASCLAKIRDSASETLRSWGKDPSLEGYRGDRNRVAEMAAAVYDAIQKLRIKYIVPPAGFEESGQRVRLADTVVSDREGTCIDVSALYCSALESIGLNTFIFLVKGHAFAGFWLVDDHMADITSIDSSAITRLIRNRDARAVECTYLCDGHAAAFDVASEAALMRLEDTESFICAVDIKKSRPTIRPLPTRRYENGAWTVEKDEFDTQSVAPKEVGEVYEAAEDRALTRVDIWKRDLLDITTRNPLVSMKVGAKAVPLLVGDTSKFGETFSKGTQFILMPKPQDWDGAGIYSERPFETETYVGNYAGSFGDELSRGWIRTPLGEADTISSLKSIYRLYKKEMEESGCNSLFIAIGVLRWFESKADRIPRYSPLILIPAELIKKQKGYVVVPYDEETVFNVTLAEKLRQEYDINIPGIDPLPLDDGILNVDRITQNVRRCIEGLEGWEVLDGAALGVFSFSQYAMWKDLEKNMGKLKENPVVEAMVSGGIYHADPELEADADPYGLCLTVPADSSQIKAVRAASEGKTFIMHGPPGTGKSQTITNIITDSIYRGKTVLFVAEKRAALDVVEKRLDGIGIGNHCLELHSDKTEKTKVLEQLRKAMEPCKEFDDSKLEETIAKLSATKEKLDAYVSDLHRKQAWGFSAYECISLYEAHNVAGAKDLRISTDTALRMKPETVGNLEDDIIKACQAYGIATSMCDTDALATIHADVPAASLQYDIEEAMDEALAAADALDAVGPKIAAAGIDGDTDRTGRIVSTVMSADAKIASDPNIARIPDVVPKIVSLSDSIFDAFAAWDPRDVRQDEAAKMLKDSGELSDLASEATEAGWLPPNSAIRSSAENVKSFCSKLIAIGPDMNRIETQWRPEVYDFDSRYNIKKGWHEADGKMLFKSAAKKKFMSDVSNVLRPGVAFESLGTTADLISAVNQDFRSLSSIPGKVASASAGIASEKASLSDILARANETISAAEAVGISADKLHELRMALEGPNGGAEDYQSAAERWEAARDKLISVMKTDADISLPEKCRAYCESIRPHLAGVFDWANWNYYASKLEEEGLGASCDAIRSGMDSNAVVNSTYRSLYKTMINLCRQESESLRMFNASTFEGTVERLRKLDSEYAEINKSLLKYRLYKNVPRNIDSSIPDSEAGKVYRAVSAGRMKKSIRTLLGEIPHMLPRLCPCLLMSPQSVSQYLTMDYPKFDIVIFDESSQITTSKAIGTLGRGKAAVIAGDRQQLPPTRFFQKQMETEESEEEIEDMESFLEDCLALNMPQTYLEWHYRSRHESLITFSNRVFYDGKMLTFPSPNDQETKVGMRFVREGRYHKGRRCNPIEAAAVVDEVYRRVMSKGYKGESIGIIAFSISQQNCIEDAMDDMTSKHPRFQKRLGKMSEGMFIKNLETVQGDERDIILFSIGYGPSREGTVIQNFGPINRPGGGRRLNVAVSRARCEMVVFSSMRYTDVKLTPASSSGVRSMREFLKFAENNGRFGDQDHAKPAEDMSAIMEDIAESLSEIGYESHFGIGSSGFRVDLAVVDPENPQEYILGILGDGDSYKKSENTRDREFARSDVLVRLGWNIMHVWSVDWFFNKKLTLKKIENRIEDILANRAAAAEEDGEELIPDDVPAEEEPQKDATEDTPADGPQVAPDESAEEEKPVDDAEPDEEEPRRRTYVPLNLQFEDVPVDVATSDRDLIRDIAGKIIAMESPVNEELLLSLYRKGTGIKRLVGNKKEALIRNLRSEFSPDIRDDFVTYWAKGADRKMRTYRAAESTADSRDIDCIPLIELMNACLDVVEASVSIPRLSCASAAGKALGFKRPGANVISTIEKAIDLAVEDRLILEEGGNLMPTEE